MNLPRRDEFRQFLPLAVRWGDCDMLGHVNNSKFFTYSESARMAYFDPLTEIDPRFHKDYTMVIASTSCDFLAQLHYPAHIEVGTRIERIGRSSMTARSALFLGDRVMAVYGTVIVWFDPAQQKSTAIPDHVRAWIHGREAIAPVG